MSTSFSIHAPSLLMLSLQILGLLLGSFILLLGSYWLLVKKQPQTATSELQKLAELLNIQYYPKKAPYAAGVYQGRGILVQLSNQRQDPTVCVFCDNPHGQNFDVRVRKHLSSKILRSFTRPAFRTPQAFETHFYVKPAQALTYLLTPPVRQCAGTMLQKNLQGTVELRGRTIGYIEGPNEKLKDISAYMAALSFCMACAQALEAQTIPQSHLASVES